MLFWGIGLVALTIIITTILLPTVTTAAEALKSYFEIIPEELMAAFGGDIADFSTPEGFLNAELFFW